MAAYFLRKIPRASPNLSRILAILPESWGREVGVGYGEDVMVVDGYDNFVLLCSDRQDRLAGYK